MNYVLSASRQRNHLSVKNSSKARTRSCPHSASSCSIGDRCLAPTVLNGQRELKTPSFALTHKTTIFFKNSSIARVEILKREPRPHLLAGLV